MQSEVNEGLVNIIAVQNNLILEIMRDNAEKENLINALLKESEIVRFEERSD